MPDTRCVPLLSSPCRNLCDWAAAPSAHDDARLLACRGCGTQWRAGLGWTPRQADGSVPLLVLNAHRADRADPRDRAHPADRADRADRREDAAGTGGS